MAECERLLPAPWYSSTKLMHTAAARSYSTRQRCRASVMLWLVHSLSVPVHYLPWDTSFAPVLLSCVPAKVYSLSLLACGGGGVDIFHSVVHFSFLFSFLSHRDLRVIIFYLFFSFRHAIKKILFVKSFCLKDIFYPRKALTSFQIFMIRSLRYLRRLLFLFTKCVKVIEIEEVCRVKNGV